MITEKSSVASYFTAFATAAGGLAFNEWMMLGGFALGIATWLTNLYYKRKTYKLLERSHDHTAR